MNDPNGLVFLDGEYHLFYQHNPEGNKWGHMSWGHAVSRDLLRWEHLPLAMREEDGIMIFSGSAVVDATNTSGLCGAAGRPASSPSTRATPREADAEPGLQPRPRAHLDEVRGQPRPRSVAQRSSRPEGVLARPAKRWVMVTVLADERKVRLFSSPDLKHWEMLSDFGPAGATGGVWECPDLFPLPVDGDPQNVRWVLDVDINPGGPAGGSGAQYFVGTFDGTRSSTRTPPPRRAGSTTARTSTRRQSYEHIPQSDGRRLWIAWMSNWAVRQ